MFGNYALFEQNRVDAHFPVHDKASLNDEFSGYQCVSG